MSRCRATIHWLGTSAYISHSPQILIFSASHGNCYAYGAVDAVHWSQCCTLHVALGIISMACGGDKDCIREELVTLSYQNVKTTDHWHSGITSLKFLDGLRENTTKIQGLLAVVYEMRVILA
jgi:hypothetical protein